MKINKEADKSPEVFHGGTFKVGVQEQTPRMLLNWRDMSCILMRPWHPMQRKAPGFCINWNLFWVLTCSVQHKHPEARQRHALHCKVRTQSYKVLQLQLAIAEVPHWAIRYSIVNQEDTVWAVRLIYSYSLPSPHPPGKAFKRSVKGLSCSINALTINTDFNMFKERQNTPDKNTTSKMSSTRIKFTRIWKQENPIQNHKKNNTIETTKCDRDHGIIGTGL